MSTCPQRASASATTRQALVGGRQIRDDGLSIARHSAGGAAQPLGVDVDHRHARAALEQELRHGQAEAPGRAGHDRAALAR